jgi:hypothetical protein
VTSPVGRGDGTSSPPPRPASPACMDARDLAAWVEANERCWASRAWSPCADCTADYAAEMRDIGRCDGRPPFPDEDVDDSPSRAPHHLASAASRRRRALRLAERAVSLREQGMAWAQVARALGVSGSWVYKWVRERAE